MVVNRPKISIVIPIYNVEAYIGSCLQSVAEQTYKGEIECWLIDDCGADKSMDIVREFVGSYDGEIDFHILKHPQNRGLSAARNTGIDHATGSYIYFLDSDDEITPHCIEKLVAPLKDEAYDIVIGDYQTLGKGSNPPVLRLRGGTTLCADDVMSSYVKGQWYVMAWNKLCSLDFLRKHHIYFKEDLLHEDELWSFQLACHARSLHAVSYPCYCYKLREGSIMVNSQAKERRIKVMTQIIAYMTDYLLRNQINSPYAAMLIMEKVYIDVWRELRHYPMRAREAALLMLQCREEISRIPLAIRTKVCRLGIKRFVRYVGAVLPKNCFVPYLRFLDILYKTLN